MIVYLPVYTEDYGSSYPAEDPAVGYLDKADADRIAAEQKSGLSSGEVWEIRVEA